MSEQIEVVNIVTNPNQDSVMKLFRAKYLELVEMVISNIPKSKQSVHALDKLQESLFWLESAVAVKLAQMQKTETKDPQN